MPSIRASFDAMPPQNINAVCRCHDLRHPDDDAGHCALRAVLVRERLGRP